MRDDRTIWLRFENGAYRGAIWAYVATHADAVERGLAVARTGPTVSALAANETTGWSALPTRWTRVPAWLHGARDVTIGDREVIADGIAFDLDDLGEPRKGRNPGDPRASMRDETTARARVVHELALQRADARRRNRTIPERLVCVLPTRSEPLRLEAIS